MKEFLTDATLKEYPTQDTDATIMLQLLLSDYEMLIQSLRNDITHCVDAHDDGNADFLTAILEQFEKTAWMLRATVS
jgi:starvation-inducible DNA-binding protein